MPFTTRDGVRLYWKLEGETKRPPLVLLNSIGTDMDLWDAALPALRESFAVLRIDTRGHGASDAPEGDYTMSGLGQDVLAVMDVAGLDKAAVAGVSLGGMMALQMALDAPHRVNAIAAICTSARMDRAAWDERTALVRSAGMAAIAELAMSRFLSPTTMEDNPVVAATVHRGLLRAQPAGYAGCAAAIRDMELSSRLGAIACPTLVVTGTQDTSTPFEGHGSLLLADIGNAHHVALECAHLAPIEEPAGLFKALSDFLSGVAS